MTISPTIKRHLVSGLVTFFSAFFLFIGANIQNIDVSSFDYFAINSLLLAGVRAAGKAAWETISQKVLS